MSPASRERAAISRAWNPWRVEAFVSVPVSGWLTIKASCWGSNLAKHLVLLKKVYWANKIRQAQREPNLKDPSFRGLGLGRNGGPTCPFKRQKGQWQAQASPESRHLSRLKIRPFPALSHLRTEIAQHLLCLAAARCLARRNHGWHLKSEVGPFGGARKRYPKGCSRF